MESNTTITYARQSSSADIALSLDDDKNQAVYDEELKIAFAPGDPVYLKFLSGLDDEYEILASAGSISRAAIDVPYPVSQDLVFSNETVAALSNLPAAGVDWKWIGRGAGSPLFDGRSVQLPERSVAVLRCEYQTLGDRLKLIVPESAMDGHNEITVNVVVIQAGMVAEQQVTIARDEVADRVQEICDVQVIVEDYCTGDRIAGATVQAAGQTVTTDSGGKCTLRDIVKGQDYEISVSATGYTASDDDLLANDSFEIPVSE